MTGKAEKPTNDISVIKKLQKDNRQSNNMRRENIAGIPTISGGFSGGGNTSTISITPNIVNLTDIDQAGTDTNIYDRLVFTGEQSIIVDDSLTLPDEIMYLKWIDSTSVSDGQEVRIKARRSRSLIIQKGGNILIPESRDSFIIDDSIWIILKYFNDASIAGPYWMIAGTQYVPNVEINHGIFPFTSNSISVSFGASYINPPIVTLGYQVHGGATPVSDVKLSSKLVTDSISGLYTGINIQISGTLPTPTTGHFISVNAICQL